MGNITAETQTYLGAELFNREGLDGVNVEGRIGVHGSETSRDYEDKRRAYPHIRTGTIQKSPGYQLAVIMVNAKSGRYGMS
jgi:hypothetical protein